MEAIELIFDSFLHILEMVDIDCRSIQCSITERSGHLAK